MCIFLRTHDILVLDNLYLKLSYFFLYNYRFFYSLGVPHTLSNVVLKAEGNEQRLAYQHKSNITHSVPNFPSGKTQ